MHAGVWVCGVGVGCGDLRVQCWNVNSMMKSEKSWLQFVNKMKNSIENVFIIVDSDLKQSKKLSLENCGMGLFSLTHKAVFKEGSLF